MLIFLPEGLFFSEGSPCEVYSHFRVQVIRKQKLYGLPLIIPVPWHSWSEYYPGLKVRVEFEVWRMQLRQF